MTEKNDFGAVFARLKAMLRPYAKHCEVLHDTPSQYYLNTRFIMKNKQPLFFAAARIGKAYVSFHLMPVYACPELLQGTSPELKRRMQGLSCFNFKTVEEKLFKELAQLTKASFARFNDEKFVNSLRLMQERSR